MQKTISPSTSEAEYYADSEMAIEVIYLLNLLLLLENMGIHIYFLKTPTPPCMRTTLRALNWATTSTVAVNVPSTLISATDSKHFEYES